MHMFGWKQKKYIDANENTAIITLHNEKIVQNTVIKMERELIKKEQDMAKQYWDMVSLLTTVLNHNQIVESGYQDDISFYTKQVYLQLQKNYPEYGITDEEISSVAHLAPIHDIGKIKVPIEIFNKNGKLTDEEMNVVKQHPLVGAAMTQRFHGAADEKKAGDFGIGDTVTYQLTSKVPDMTGYTSYTFKFTDTLSKGLDLKAILSVKVGSTELKAGKTGANTYALSYDKTTRILTVTLNDFYNSYKGREGETITVVYTATLNKDAVIGMNPNTNKAVVEYSNDPKSDGTGKSEPSIVDVHTFDFTIYKYYLKDQNNKEDKTALAKAEFELYKGNTEGTAADEQAKVNIVDEGNGVYRQATADEAKAADFTSAKIVSDADGKVLVKGLEAGTYYLRETKAPEGYNKLLSDIKVVIEANYDTTTGKLTNYTVTYTYNGNPITVTNTDKLTSPEVPVENKTGAQLPSTGSKGALMVTLAGIVLFGVLTASKAFGKKKAKN